MPNSKKIFILIFSVFCLFFITGLSLPCTGTYTSIEQSFKQASEVVLVRITRAEETDQNNRSRVVVHYKMLESFKGPGNKTGVVFHPRGRPCARNFDIGRYYLLFIPKDRVIPIPNRSLGFHYRSVPAWYSTLKRVLQLSGKQ